jgi:hypothetical protein
MSGKPSSAQLLVAIATSTFYQSSGDALREMPQRDIEVPCGGLEDRSKRIDPVAVVVRVDVRRSTIEQSAEALELRRNVVRDDRLQFLLRPRQRPTPRARLPGPKFDVQPDVEPWITPGVGRGFRSGQPVHHQACTGRDPRFVHLGDSSVDAAAVPEIVSIDDEQYQ